MSAIGGNVEAMDISSSDVPKPKGCCLCTRPVTDEYFVRCATCHIIAHSICVRVGDWSCENCSIMIEEEEEEDEKLSENSLIASSPFGVCGVFRTVRPHGLHALIKANEEQTAGHLFYTKLQVGEVVDIGETILHVKIGEELAFWTDVGTKLINNGITYILLGLDDILGFFEFDYSKPGIPKCEDISNLIPCADRVLVQIAEKDEESSKGSIVTSPMGTVATVSYNESEIEVGVTL